MRGVGALAEGALADLPATDGARAALAVGVSVAYANLSSSTIYPTWLATTEIEIEQTFETIEIET